MYVGLRARTPGQASAPNLLSRGRWGRAGFYNQRLCERPGQLEAIFDASGVSCEILVGGKLGVGDAVGIGVGALVTHVHVCGAVLLSQ